MQELLKGLLTSASVEVVDGDQSDSLETAEAVSTGGLSRGDGRARKRGVSRSF